MMRYLFILILALSGYGTAPAQETSRFTNWNDFVATTARTFRTGTNRIVISEEPHISDKYTERTFEAEASVNGYYIIILYNSKFCTNTPTEYFNYGPNTGGDYTFHGDHDGEYCYHLLKVKTNPGKTGHVYIKTTGTASNSCDLRTVKLYVIEF